MKKNDVFERSVPINFTLLLRMMKLCFVFLIVFNLSMAAATHAQVKRISLNMENAELRQVFKKLKQQTGMRFFYNGERLRQAGLKDIHIQDLELDKALAEILEGTQLTWSFWKDVVVIQDKESALTEAVLKEKRLVKGTVKGVDGTPIPGASVIVKGTQTGVATDVDGHFEIRVEDKPGLTFVVSFVGMKTQEVAIGKSDVLAIVLEDDAKALEEVVVTGFQTISKERATGAFDVISSEQLSRPASDLSSRLIGVTAGVQNNLDADGNLVFEIRGQTSLNKDNARPLIVVDGFPVEGEFSSINPNDVESVTILKDAAAASIWGARSANGVIVVTTKRGKAGAKKGATIEVSAFAKISPKIDLDYYNPLASSAETVEYERKGFANDYFGGPWGVIDNSYINARQSASQAVIALNEHRLGFLSEADLNKTLERFSRQNNKEQIKKYLLQNPLTHQYNINISGATERMTNMLSLMYESDRDGFKENKKDKVMVNYRTNIKLFKWLDFNFSGMVQYNNIKNSGINASGLSRYATYRTPNYHAAYGSIQDLSPYDMLVDEEGNLTKLPGGFYTPILDRLVPIANFPYQDWSYNPITEIRNRDLGRKELNTRVQGGFTVRFLEGLTFDTKFQHESYSTTYTDIFQEETYYVRELVNISSTWNKTTDEITANLPKGGIKDETKVNVRAYNFRNQLNFVRTFADRHDVNVIAGMEVSDRVREQTDYARTYGYNDETLSVGIFPNGPQGSHTVNWLGGSNDGNAAFGYTNKYAYATDRYFSLYANVAYTFDEKYTVSGSVRTDASNLITDDPKYRYSPFWSVGLGWQIGKENFMASIDWLDRLNIRATYGYNGNVDKSTSFRPLLNVNTNQNSYIHNYMATIGSFGNPTLRWEKTGTWDLGIDYSVLAGKLYGKIDVYSKLGKDLIASMTIPSVNGTARQSLNAAKMSNRGIEVEIGSTLPIFEDKIAWTGNLNFSYNKNKINHLYKTTYYAYELYGGGTSSYVEGYDANTLWTFEYAGLINQGTENNPDWQPMIKGANGDHYAFSSYAYYTEDPLLFMKDAGTRIAPWGFGFSNSFKIYDFNVSFMLTGKFGHKFMRTSFNYPSMADRRALPNKYYSEIVNSDPNQRLPIPFENPDPGYYMWTSFYPYLDYLVESAAHIRLQEVNISYNMPARWLSKIGINSLQIYAQGNNLCTWLKNSYKEDPEYPLGTVKPQAAYTFGLRFDF